MKKGLKSGLASKTGAVALALTFVAGNAGAAFASCAAPHEMTALRVAALRQHLMVAALACHEAPYFNQFVTTYRAAFQDSDHVLLHFFEREGSGESGYNAYKTREANDSSLRSLSDPQFCGAADAAFYVALHNNLTLEALATEEAGMLRVGYTSCTRSADADTSFASPALPARHADLMENAAAAPAVAPAVLAAPAATPPAAERMAAIPQAPTAEPAPPPPDDNAVASDPPADQNADNATSSPPAYGYRAAYNAPSYYGADYRRWYPYAQPQMRQVMGPDGRWYLVPAY
jgi:hypothetical protein